MTHSRKWEEAHLHSCLYLLPHKVAPIECTNHCAFNKHDAQVPAVLDMRAISTRPLAWSSVHCGYRHRGRRVGGKIEMRGGGRRGISEYWWWQNQTGGLDFPLNSTLKHVFTFSLVTQLVPKHKDVKGGCRHSAREIF